MYSGQAVINDGEAPQILKFVLILDLKYTELLKEQILSVDLGFQTLADVQCLGTLQLCSFISKFFISLVVICALVHQPTWSSDLGWLVGIIGPG